MAFLDKCDQLRIIVLILPPHSTHRLQPLDVSLFQPLATAYSYEINKILHESGGIVSLLKRMFWSCFKASWNKSFTESNILSAFEKTGLWPYNPTKVIKIISPRPITPPETTLGVLKTPKTSKSIRHFQNDYLKNPSKAKLEMLFRANEALAAAASIQEHRANNLEGALEREKKKRQRGKRLGLTGKEVKGAQLFGVDEIQVAREFQANKEAEIEAEKKAKEEAKVQRAVRKELEKQEKERRAVQREIDRQMKKDLKAQEKADKEAAKLAKKELKKAAPVSKVSQKRQTVASKNRDIEGQESEPQIGDLASIPPPTTRSGRATALPQRFKQK
jgi:DDE superfamily endonuclease